MSNQPDRPWERAETVDDGAAERAADSRVSRLLVGACILAVIVIGWVIFGGGSSDSEEPSPPSDFEAQRQCERWVSEQLKAPTTAAFSGQAAVGGPAEWTVTGAVDAENSFGATIRTQWTCDIRLDGETWRGRAELLD